jgi:hypothetical protein
MSTPNDLLTVQEFADLIRVHPMSIYRRIRQHRQPGVLRFGRDIRIDRLIALQPVPEAVSGSSSIGSALTRLFKGA